MRSTRSRAIALVAAALSMLGAACVRPTNFTGEPHVPDGARGCAARCQQEGLVMSAFFVLGEYSSGCVCQAPYAPPPMPGPSGPGQAAPPQPSAPAAAGAAAAAAGVAMQMRRQQEQQQMDQQLQR